jgi:hypothetical protein
MRLVQNPSQITRVQIYTKSLRADSFVIPEVGVSVIQFGELGRFAMPIPLV